MWHQRLIKNVSKRTKYTPPNHVKLCTVYPRALARADFGNAHGARARCPAQLRSPPKQGCPLLGLRPNIARSSRDPRQSRKSRKTSSAVPPNQNSIQITNSECHAVSRKSPPLISNISQTEERHLDRPEASQEAVGPGRWARCAACDVACEGPAECARLMPRACVWERSA